MTLPFRLPVSADIHHAPSQAEAADAPAERRCRAGLELARRAVEDAKRRGGFDAIALVGDLLNHGEMPSGPEALAAVRDQIRKAAPDAPLLVVPGNHDGDPGRFAAVFGERPGVREMGGYRFVTFFDAYDARDRCSRSEADRERLRRLASEPGGPIVALQHNPLHPPIVSDYPYLPTNAAEVVRDYAEAGVLLSVSGHYHAGQAPAPHGDTHYVTAPGLCEGSLPYTLVTLEGRKVSVETRGLRMADVPRLVDSHAHTEFAYCRADVTAAGVLERARLLGLAGVCLVEHAPQLYCAADDFWAGRHISRPSVWRGAGASRMREFRQAMAPLRSDFVRVGLEVELDADGRMTLRDEDRAWPDLLVGAVHFLPEDFRALPFGQLASGFMRSTEGLLGAGVDVLAHPWRLFRWAERAAPADLFVPVAQALADTGTATEINFHGNDPEAGFLGACLERGVKVAFGSDAHALREVGAFGPHLDLLRRVAGTEDVGGLLAYA